LYDGRGYFEDRANRDQAFETLYQSTADVQVALENYNSRQDVQAAAFDEANRAIQAATGVQMPNPLRAARGVTRRDGPQATSPEDRWYARRAELMEQFPDAAGAIRAVDPVAEQLRTTRGALARQQDAEADPSLSGTDRFLASTLGSMAGMMRDPMVVASMVVGAGAGTAQTVVGRIFQVAATEAAINGGVESVLAARAMEWKRDNGIEASWQDAAVQVGTAAALGGVFGGAFQSGAELLQAYGRQASDAVPALDRVLRGQAEPGDVEQAIVALGGTLDDDTRRALQEADDVLADEQAIAQATDDALDVQRDDAPLMPPQEALQAQQAQAVRYVENVGEPAPDPVYGRSVVREGVDELSRDVSTARVDGRPVARETFAPARLQTDAAAYQYKGGADETGQTDRLANVARWDETLSGMVFVHRRADGDFVADGHQRAGLARRLADEGQDVRVPGFVLDEADGWTVGDVRALAARKNLAEGSGTPLDAARVLRDRPDLIDDALPTTGQFMQKAEGLARLSDDGWSMAANGVVPEDFAARVGFRVEDPSMHAPVLDAMLREPPATQREADLLIDELLNVPRLAETVRQQGSLFSDDAALTVMVQRVQVLDRALVELRQDKAVFKKLTDNADVIERAGNVLDAGANSARVDTAAYLETMLSKLARRTGSPVSEALNRAALAYAESGKKNAAAFSRAFVDDVSQLVETRGLDELLADPHAVPTRPEPFSPERAAETNEAAALLRDAEPETDDLFGAQLRGYDENGEPVMGTVQDILDDADMFDVEADVITNCRAQTPGVGAGA
jgi:hypothetical protein